MISLKRYREGFDRLGFVVFVVVGMLFVAVYFSVHTAYVMPAPESAAGIALAAELAVECANSENQIMGALCEESAVTARRWEHFKNQYATGNASIWVVWLGAALALAYVLASARWVIIGFGERRSEAITLKQKIVRIFEDSFFSGFKKD